jgi:hypothetical protein
MNRKEFEFIFGIICLLIALILAFREIKKWRELDEQDYILKSNSIKKIGAIIVFILIGIVGIYRYIS